jgi:DNA topoisomerase I
VARLVKALKGASAVYLATDPDREGEAIAWHILQVADLDDAIPVYRVRFNAITAAAVKAALQHPQTLDVDLVEAQQARRLVDRLVGYLASPLACKALDGRFSAGCVQSVALRLVVEREREIAAFTPHPYQTLSVQLQTADGAPLMADLSAIKGMDTQFTNAAPLRKLVQRLQTAQFWVTQAETKTVKRQPAPPFTTSSLQQAAADRLDFTPARTMQVAQILYEAGRITYHRTDALHVAPEAQQAAREIIAQQYGDDYRPPEAPTYIRKAAAVQGAHEAIRPVKVDDLPDDNGDGDGAKLYALIWQRFVASQMAAARDRVQVIQIAAGALTDKPLPLRLQARAQQPDFDGFRRVYATEDDDTAAALPAVAVGQPLTWEKPLVANHKTRAPARYTPASLIAALERAGVGRPATYASMVQVIQDKGYVTCKKRQFRPTEQGERLLDFLTTYFDAVIDVHYTADLEAQLDRIAAGDMTRHALLRDFWTTFQPGITASTAHITDVVIDTPCPTCGGELVMRHGARGSFLGCSNFPQCTHTQAAQPLHLQPKADAP